MRASGRSPRWRALCKRSLTASTCLTAFLKYRNIDKLTREILGKLIDHIKVYEGGNISVKFKYADVFRRIAEYIELNSPMVTGAAG